MSAVWVSGEKLRASKLNLVKGTWTPSLSAAGGTNVLGTGGFLTGSYWRYLCSVTYIIDLSITATGTIAGTSWRITLPFVADLTVQTANILNQASSIIGSFQSRSGTAAQTATGSCLLSGPSGTDTTGTALIFYTSASNSSLGSSNFTTTAQLKATGTYLADPSAF